MLELEIEPHAPPVRLRRGPKSYCYGPFVGALELCRRDDDGIDDAANGREHGNRDVAREDGGSRDARGDVESDGGADDGLEAFLDSCDRELEEGEGDECDDACGENDDDCFYGTSAIPTAARVDDLGQKSITSDLRAIDAFKKILHDTKDGCVKNPLASLRPHTRYEDSNGISDEDRYCAMLIQSEIQTLDFYMAAAESLQRRLAEHYHRASSAPVEESQPQPVGPTKVDDDKVFWEQVNALVDAFLSIRYPQFKIKA